MPTILRRPGFALLATAILTLVLPNGYAVAKEPEIIIIGSQRTGIDLWKRHDFWGEVDRSKDLDVPPILIVAINPGWLKEANKMTVALKKEFFYRGLAPLVLHANESILRDRARLEKIASRLGGGTAIGDEDRSWLEDLGRRYRLLGNDRSGRPRSVTQTETLIGHLLNRVDAIPPSLALGQAAYESAYGTSRFTLKGNALFGQWTWGGKGIKPKRQRLSKGNYKIASFDWPLDSVRSYMRNLNTHRTYAPLRKLRSDIRKQGRLPSGMELAGTLQNYSEKGETYVRTLRSIIRVNGLDVADKAYLRDEPPILVVNVDTEEEVSDMQREIERLRATGELTRLIESMRLDSD